MRKANNAAASIMDAAAGFVRQARAELTRATEALVNLEAALAGHDIVEVTRLEMKWRKLVREAAATMNKGAHTVALVNGADLEYVEQFRETLDMNYANYVIEEMIFQAEGDMESVGHVLHHHYDGRDKEKLITIFESKMAVKQ